MNLDELSEAIGQISSEEVVQQLSRLLVDWKNDDKTVEDLKKAVERYLGNTWIESREDYENIYRMWSTFRDQTISGIGGMTMNERLYHFGLFERFDGCKDQEAQLVLYRKLHATH